MWARKEWCKIFRVLKEKPRKTTNLEFCIQKIIIEKWREKKTFSGKKTERGLPWRLSGKESACQCRRHGFDPWLGKSRMLWSSSAGAPQLSSLCPGAWEQQPEPTCHSCWSLCSTTREATATRSPCIAIGSSSHLPQLEQSPCSSEDPAQPKIIKLRETVARRSAL